MTLFSQRHGFKPIRVELQTKDIDAALHSKLWNTLQIYYWHEGRDNYLPAHSNSDLYSLLKKVWHSYFKQPLDTLPTSWLAAYQALREHFFGCEWYEVYDFIEFIALADS